jgi:hypothetical protein
VVIARLPRKTPIVHITFFVLISTFTSKSARFSFTQVTNALTILEFISDQQLLKLTLHPWEQFNPYPLTT